MPVSPRQTRRARLGLERLETRATPASISLVAGNLTVSNNKGAIQLIQDAGGTFTVLDNGNNLGTYAVGGNVTINTLNLNDSISVSLFPGKLLPGSLTINSLNGNDTIAVFGGGGGRLGGNLIINASNGNDVINLGLTSGFADSGIRLSGATLVAAGAGLDAVNVGTSLLGNNFTATQANSVNLGFGGASTQLNGNLVIDNSADYAAANAVNLGANSVVAGSFKYVGGSGDDDVTMNGVTCGVAGSYALVDTGASNGSLTLTGLVGAFVAADLTFQGGNNPLAGTDQATIAGSAIVTGDLNLVMNHGLNLYNLASNFLVGGDFNLSAGSDDDAVGNIDAIIGGDVNVSLGSGDDQIAFGTFGLGLGSIGGDLSVGMGDGDDTVALNVNVDSGLGTAFISLGAGADRFTACDPLNSLYGAATIDFGVDTDNDFSEVLLTALSPFTTYQNVSGGDVISTCLPRPVNGPALSVVRKT